MMALLFDVSLNELLKSAIYASVNGIAVFLSVRYLGRMVDRIEKAKDNDNSKGKGPGKEPEAT